MTCTRRLFWRSCTCICRAGRLGRQTAFVRSVSKAFAFRSRQPLGPRGRAVGPTDPRGVPGRPAVQHYSAWQDRYFFRSPRRDCPRETRVHLAAASQFPHPARHSRVDSAVEMWMRGRRFCERERSQNRAGRGSLQAALGSVMTDTSAQRGPSAHTPPRSGSSPRAPGPIRSPRAGSWSSPPPSRGSSSGSRAARRLSCGSSVAATAA